MNLNTLRLGVLAAVTVFLFSLSPFNLFAQIPSPTPLTIKQTDVPIRVDGHLNDWPEARVIYLGISDQLTLGKQFWKGEDDFNGHVFLTYDQQYLYVAAIVQKKYIVVNPLDLSVLQKTGSVANANVLRSLWNGDCLELFLSTRTNISGSTRLSKGDYHIGFSPGTDCKTPQVYCFNKDETIPGSRIVARNTPQGYLLEACIPLEYFQGLQMWQGKSFGFDAALDKAGSTSGFRIVRLDYGGKAADPEDPSTWLRAQWQGELEQAIPFRETEDLYADLVQDGTRGAIYAGVKTVAGIALDSDGKPLAGVGLSTWPKTQETKTDSKGAFQFNKIKVYDKTVFYGRLDGYAGTLSPWQAHSKAVTLRLYPLPQGFKPNTKVVSPFFFGISISAPPADQMDSFLSANTPFIKALNPGLIRLNLSSAAPTLEDGFVILDQFTAFARQIGAEPMVSLPLNRDHPEIAAQWVHHCNLEKKEYIRFWALGDEPDTGVKGMENYNAYDYINDFRVQANSLKREDPSILLLGPEAGWKYARNEDDWITSLLQYDADVVDGISIHHYASALAANLPATIAGDLRQLDSLVLTLRDKVSQVTDLNIRLAVTGEKACSGPVTGKSKEDVSNLLFWEALWEAEKKGNFLNQHCSMDVATNPWDILSGAVTLQPNPTYWILSLWGRMIRGEVIDAQIQSPGMSAYATQDPTTKNVTLLIVNKEDRYWRPKTLLNGQDADLSVDAGLDQRYDFEIPSLSVCFLSLKADRTPGQMLIYTLKMARAGKEPQVMEVKPW